jgi:hypothetical protein
MKIQKVLVPFILINLLLGGILTAAEKSRDAFQGHSYLLAPQKKNWQMAKRDAEGQGGYLVVINSNEEQQFLEKLLSEALRKENYKDPVWIGLTDEENEGAWKWVNGETLKFTNWQKNQPSNANGITPENYCVIWNSVSNGSKKGQWNDIAGDNTMRYLIEWDSTDK